MPNKNREEKLNEIKSYLYGKYIDLGDNYKELDFWNNKIQFFQKKATAHLDSETFALCRKKTSEIRQSDYNINKELDGLDWDDSKNHRKILELNEDLVKNKNDCHNFIAQLVKEKGTFVPSHLKNSLDDAHSGRDKILKDREKIIKDISDLLTAQDQLLEGKTSLLDDFADPNLEQPSYTDPED